jgi:excisionase family DNA binding protein
MDQRKDAEGGPHPDGTPPREAAQAALTLLLKLPEAAQELRVSKRYIEEMVRKDILPTVKIGRERMIARDDLRAYIKRQRRFRSYFITPEAFKLERKHKDDKRLAEEFEWD